MYVFAETVSEKEILTDASISKTLSPQLTDFLFGYGSGQPTHNLPALDKYHFLSLH